MDYDIEELQNRIKAIANLPTLPHIASRLMRIVNSPDTSANTIAAAVAQDVSLSARVLRLANSAFYGIPQTINTLNHAVVILGFKIIETMVLSLTVFDMFSNRGGRETLFDRKVFWKHSLRCGVISRLLAFRRRKVFALDPEAAFCAGLLHDIGKIVMEQYMNADFHKALHQARMYDTGSFEAEKNVLGYTHCDVASWLTGAWSLPDEILQPLVYHHEPMEAPVNADAVMVCHIADIVSKIEGDRLPQETAGALKPKLGMLGLSAHDLTDIFEEIPSEMEKASLFITDN